MEAQHSDDSSRSCSSQTWVLLLFFMFSVSACYCRPGGVDEPSLGLDAQECIDQEHQDKTRAILFESFLFSADSSLISSHPSQSFDLILICISTTVLRHWHSLPPPSSLRNAQPATRNQNSSGLPVLSTVSSRYNARHLRFRWITPTQRARR